MIKKTLNYIDANGNNATDQFYFISEDAAPILIHDNTSATNCPNCGAPIDIYKDKCPYCDTPYEFIRGRRRNIGVYDDAIPQQYNDLLSCGAISINEMRELCGLSKIFEESR